MGSAVHPSTIFKSKIIVFATRSKSQCLRSYSHVYWINNAGWKLKNRQPSWFSEYWKAGIAASVAFAIGLSFSVLQTPAQQDLAQYALAHVRSEMPMVEENADATAIRRGER